MRSIKGCIFDLDGVIVDTAKYHYVAWKRLAKQLGFDLTPEQNEQLKGISRMQSLEILLEIGNLSMDRNEKEKMAAIKNGWYLELVGEMKPDEILPGAKELILKFKENNILVALGSSSKNARKIMDQIELTPQFDAIIDGTMIGKAKPDPEIFLKGAETLGLKAEECAVFEDAVAGVAAAKSGNMTTIGVGSAETLSEADMVVPSLDGSQQGKIISFLFDQQLHRQVP